MAVSPIPARLPGRRLHLRDEIRDRFDAGGVLTGATVNLALSSARVDLENKIQPGETLFVRLLNLDGVALTGRDPSVVEQWTRLSPTRSSWAT
jgi:hypothetical protein